jgi:hypothetical protein
VEVSGQLQAPAPLPPGNSPRYLLNRRLDASRVSLDAERIIFTPTVMEPTFLGSPVSSVVIMLVQISRLPLPLRTSLLMLLGEIAAVFSEKYSKHRVSKMQNS